MPATSGTLYGAETERPLRLIRLPTLLDRTALSRSEVYRRVRDDPNVIDVFRHRAHPMVDQLIHGHTPLAG